MLLRGVRARTLRAANTATAATVARQRAFVHYHEVAPAVLNVGTPRSPCLETLRPGFTTRRNYKSDDNSKELIAGVDTLKFETGLHDRLPVHMSGAYSSTATKFLTPFALAAAVEQPDRVALWTLTPGTTIPDPIIVLSDDWQPDVMVWAPREPMELSAYRAALASVGRDAEGKPRNWTRWADPTAVVESLPMPDEEKTDLTARANAQRALYRKFPVWREAVLGRALLTLCFASVGTEEAFADGTGDIDFLSAMAELAAVIPHNRDIYEAFARTCRRLNELRDAEAEAAASVKAAAQAHPQPVLAAGAAPAQSDSESDLATPAETEVVDAAADRAVEWWSKDGYAYAAARAPAPAPAPASTPPAGATGTQAASGSASASASASVSEAPYFTSTHLTTATVHALARFTGLGLGGSESSEGSPSVTGAGPALTATQRRDILFVERALQAAHRGIFAAFESLDDSQLGDGESDVSLFAVYDFQDLHDSALSAARALGFKGGVGWDSELEPSWLPVQAVSAMRSASCAAEGL